MQVQHWFLKIWVIGRSSPLPERAAARWRAQAGEGVISTAIAVLIMTLIGLAMWRLFNTVFNDAGNDIQKNVNDLGS
jgi:hypothetical protein